MWHGSKAATLYQWDYGSLISIHLMLWFNLNSPLPSIILSEFQYISCYGSIFFCRHLSNLQQYFNTFHVMVQYADGQGIFFPFTYFNTSHVMVQSYTQHKIQYRFYNFNTSHVMVQLLYIFQSWRNILNFNTSHVMVQ